MGSCKTRTQFFVTALLISAFARSSPLFSANVTGTLVGTIKDASCGLATRATVSLTNTQTNVSRSVPSNSDGTYLNRCYFRLEKCG